MLRKRSTSLKRDSNAITRSAPSEHELRNIDEDTYLVVELHEDEYWMQGEGRVSYVKEYDSGKVTVGVTGL